MKANKILVDASNNYFRVDAILYIGAVEMLYLGDQSHYAAKILIGSTACVYNLGPDEKIARLEYSKLLETWLAIINTNSMNEHHNQA